MRSFQKIENKQELQRLLNKALFKTFFHSLEWQEFLEKEFKWLKFEHYLYKDELLLSFGKIGKKLVSLPFCEYGGPLPLKERIDFEKFSKDVLEEFGNNIKIKFHPRILNRESDTITYFIENLDKLFEEKILNSFRKTLRHSIKNAQKQDLKIKKCSSPKELKQFYNLYAANLKKRKTVPYPFSVIKFLYSSADSELLLAWYKGRIVAGSLFLHYDKFIHYFLSASDYKYRNLGANYLILWEKIRKSLDKDYKVFDLGAAPKGSSLEVFKRGWGGKEYSIIQLGIKKIEETLRSSKLRDIWGLLPNFIVKKVSPFLIRYRL
jgi:hypothetical protein